MQFNTPKGLLPFPFAVMANPSGVGWCAKDLGSYDEAPTGFSCWQG